MGRAVIAFQFLFPVLALAIVLPLGMYSVVLAAGFAFVLVTLTLTALLGLERAGGLFVLAAIAAAPLNNIRPVPGLSFVTFADVLFVVGFLILIPHFAGTPLSLPSPFVAGAVLILAIGSLASIASDDAALSFNHMMRLAVGAFALAIALCWWRPNLKTVTAAAAAYLLGNVISVVYAVIQGPPAGGRHVGLSTHPNIMGVCDALALSLIPFLYVTVRREHRWLVLLGAAMCAYGIWINGSRGALLTSFALLVLYPVITRSLTAGLGVVAIGFAIPIAVSHVSDTVSDTSALGRLLGRGNVSGSNEAREDAARIAIDQFTSSPLLGGGFGPILEAHNIYLQIAAAVGAFGLLGFMLIMWALVRPLLVYPEPYGLLALPGLAYAMSGMIIPLLWDRYVWCVLALGLMAPILAGAAGHGARRADQVPPATPGAQRTGHRVST